MALLQLQEGGFVLLGVNQVFSEGCYQRGFWLVAS